jgi:hypothetical protein
MAHQGAISNSSGQMSADQIIELLFVLPLALGLIVNPSNYYLFLLSEVNLKPQDILNGLQKFVL